MSKKKKKSLNVPQLYSLLPDLFHPKISTCYHRVDVTAATTSALTPVQPWWWPSRDNPCAHAQCRVSLDPISYFNGPNKRERDIRKMATALVVSVPLHIRNLQLHCEALLFIRRLEKTGVKDSDVI